MRRCVACHSGEMFSDFATAGLAFHILRRLLDPERATSCSPALQNDDFGAEQISSRYRGPNANFVRVGQFTRRL
jgi:hypothetical protein